MSIDRDASGDESQRTEREWAALLRTMAHPVRLLILETLCERPHCVKHLNALIPIPQPHLSQHMAALRKADLVACHACGPVRCYYLLRPTLVRGLIDLLRVDHRSCRRERREVVEEARKSWEDDCQQGASGFADPGRECEDETP
ncbi:MAG: winged helix-turn-helix transcriptional regulator [Pirellulales bacterium]|nr:winged helix-turn-helix transcriptional regulator [Pirellulales bacterium]